MLNTPLFNKPAVVFKNEIVNILRVNCLKGTNVSRGTDTVELSENQYNTKSNLEEVRFIDLMYEK